MGACLSQEQDKDLLTSKSIDKSLKDEKRQNAKLPVMKVLLLGTGESGKSTIFKQIKIIHMRGFNKAELSEYRVAAAKNVMEAIVQLIKGIEVLGLKFEDQTNVQTAAELLEEADGYSLDFVLSARPAKMIAKIWADPAAKAAMAQTSKFHILDSGKYFFDNVMRIADPKYIPNNDDVLRARVKTTGISEIKFSMDNFTINMFDVGGQRSERRKWIHCFEGVTSVIFIVALSEYDQVLAEDSSQNRMIESLVLFESLVNSRWFVKSSIILFLNKTDLFRDKLKMTPLSQYFPEFTGANEFEPAAQFILSRFELVNRQNLKIYPHLTCATDTEQVQVVMAAVKDTLIKNTLKSVGIM